MPNNIRAFLILYSKNPFSSGEALPSRPEAPLDALQRHHVLTSPPVFPPVFPASFLGTLTHTLLTHTTRPTPLTDLQLLLTNTHDKLTELADDELGTQCILLSYCYELTQGLHLRAPSHFACQVLLRTLLLLLNSLQAVCRCWLCCCGALLSPFLLLVWL